MNSKALRVADYVGHILQAIERIERYTAGTSQEEFFRDGMAQDAVIRNLEIVGEACRGIERNDPGFPARYPDFPLRAAVEMRNVLAHDYFGVDLEIVWRTVGMNLPGLKEQALRIVADERGS